MSIESRVIETVRIQMGLAQGVVTSKSHIVNDLGGDSLDEVEVLMGIEDEFEIEISDYDAGKINTVQDAIDYITKRIA